jgi:hypothetical protein
MLCILSGVSWTGTSGASIFISGISDMDGFGSSAVAGGPAATGCVSPDIGVFMAAGSWIEWERYAQIPATTIRTAIQTREVLKIYLFIAVSLP